MQTTTYWEVTKLPHELAFKNLDKLVRACLENNHTSPQNCISARKLSKLAEVNYNSMANLLDRPGFVKVTGLTSGWYYLRDMGMTYPKAFPSDLPIPREVKITRDSITNNAEADKTIRSQIKPEALLESNQRIITLPGMDRTTPTSRNDIVGMLTAMADSMIKLESPPERYASAIYEVAEAIHNGVLKVTQE